VKGMLYYVEIYLGIFVGSFCYFVCFSIAGMLVIGDYAMFVGMLCLTFVLIKDEKTKEVIVSNICLLVVILILWFSDDTFQGTSKNV
jgi:thiamine transporter ThiT